MANKTIIEIRVGKKKTQNTNSQKVNYIYCYDVDSVSGFYGDFLSNKLTYAEIEELYSDIAICMNYTSEGDYTPSVGLATMVPGGIDKFSVYRREIWENGGQSINVPVALDYSDSIIVDYNIANNRTYLYSIYPYASSIGSGKEYGVKNYIAQTDWDYYSITELHPVIGATGKYTASSKDVWLFKYNVDFQSQKQTLSKNKQETLGKYPKFSSGLSNYLEGSLSALLGKEVIASEMLEHKLVPTIENNEVVWEDDPVEGYQVGGYTEKLKFNERMSSNDKIDMLEKWREICYSGNPKLLKDLKGQKILIQISDSSNTNNDKLIKIPDTISFQWTQIGDADDIQIVGSK